MGVEEKYCIIAYRIVFFIDLQELVINVLLFFFFIKVNPNPTRQTEELPKCLDLFMHLGKSQEKALVKGKPLQKKQKTWKMTG